MRPLGCTEQYNWKHNRAAAISFTWTLQQYKINFWCPRDPLLILRCVIKPSEACEYRVTAHWLASYWKMCTRRNTRDCTSGSADVNKLLCGRGGIERVRGVTITKKKKKQLKQSEVCDVSVLETAKKYIFTNGNQQQKKFSYEKAGNQAQPWKYNRSKPSQAKTLNYLALKTDK